MNNCKLWLKPIPTIKKTLALLTLSTLSASLIAAEIDKSAIDFIGPLGENMPAKPYQTQHRDAIINTLLPQLTSDSNSIRIFNDKVKWQAFDDVSGLTMPGLQALKFTANASRFSQGKLNLSGFTQVELFINGEKQKGNDHSYDLALTQGQHQVVIIAEQVADWNQVKLDFKAKAEHDTITFNRNKRHGLSAKQLFDAPTISAVSMAPDSQHYITVNNHYQANHGNAAIKTTEIKNENNQTIYRFESGTPSNFSWSPDNQNLVYLLDGKLQQLNRKTLQLKTLAENLTGASDFNYLNDTSLIFSWSKSEDEKNPLTKHYRGLQDRWSYARSNSQIFLMDTQSGLIKALTEGPLSYNLEDFNAEQNTVLVSRAKLSMEASTHPITELVEIQLQTTVPKVLGEFKTFNQAKYAGENIYVVAGPDFKNGLGRNLPENMLANNYDGQLYLLKNNGSEAQALSKNFTPAIGQLDVLANGDALMKVTEQDTVQLYQFDISKEKFKKLNTGFDVVERFSFSKERNAKVLVTGSTASTPQQLKRLDINRNKAKTLWDSMPSGYENTDIAKLEEFNFTNKEGVEITGRVYLPHDLDKSKQYPALVYYYGGTSPVTRGFTGRYPFNLWAEHGYVVYVVQPTGATGFGQTFSAKHVNAWGQYTANDIIEGTQAFLNKYSFVDSKRVGNLGASYGGFMTMLLATKTDLFSASISHAGISNITSYWGQGWWGYLYSGEASKNSFPWNNANLYSQHSPVFNADKVTTPLLLLHGDADTNVPVGESHTMYTALKLLGKDVELIEYKGADHQIFARDKRFNWWHTKLAYFDKYLKNEPEWWQYLYAQ